MIAAHLTRGAFLRASLPPVVAFAAVLSTPQRADRGSVTSRIETVQVGAKDLAEGVSMDRGAALEVKITPGKRAYGILINDAASVDGMVQPNSRVDIMVVIDNKEQGKQVAKVVMENMRVLAIGAAEPQAGRPISGAIVSIEVTPSEAERLAIAAAQGSLQLVLRGYGDADSVTTTGAVLGRESAKKHR